MLAETVCSALAAAGLGIAAVTAYRKRFLTAARLAAYALVPAGLVLTGVVAWAADIVFKPTVWAGFGVLALAWALFATTRAVERRALGKAGRAGQVDPSGRAAGKAGKPGKAPRAARGSAAPEAVAPAASAPSLGKPAARPAPAPDDDFSDIEAILKKHGI
ncbi:hypothetical protein HYE82_26295 [Streptomyces sp. BR123]|uniref:hypothetical protein n=1 Tax=Streptomyces sp. BR123 TaxID=2749828 RepID=UPI0015C46921|nr:hypothetical protein [Streptomyces sp. BR123]NXY97821.1 hypothetical protein [Streptomyces sp. BR123]